MRSIAICLFTLLLTGCAEYMARAVTNADYLADSAEAYVSENHNDRRWVRETCRAALRAEVAELQKEGKHAEIRALLARQYPSLVTVDLIDQVQDGEAPFGSSINKPWPCLDRVPTLNSETGLLEAP